MTSEARHLSVVPTPDERDEESRLAVRLCEVLWGAAHPRSRVTLKQPWLAEQVSCSARWVSELTDRLESRLLLATERQGSAGILFKLLVSLDEAVDVIAAEGLRAIVNGVTTSDSTSDRRPETSERTSDRLPNGTSDRAHIRARESLEAPPAAPRIGTPLTSDLNSDPSGPAPVNTSSLTPEGWLAYLGMSHRPEWLAEQWEAFTDDQRAYCVEEVQCMDPPTTNWRALRQVMKTAAAREVGIRMQRAAGEKPAIEFSAPGHVSTGGASIVEVAVAAALAAMRAMSEQSAPVAESGGGDSAVIPAGSVTAQAPDTFEGELASIFVDATEAALRKAAR